MATALNMTAPLKQDPESKRKLAELKAGFAAHVQPAIEAALRKSQLVHFARVVVIEDKYIQVLTEFDGDKQVYTDFFRKALPGVFEKIFELVEGAPPWDKLKDDSDAFFKASQHLHIRSLGDNPDGSGEGYLFSAYGDRKVQEILSKLK